MLYPLQLFIILFIDFVVIMIKIWYATRDMNQTVKTELPGKRPSYILIPELHTKKTERKALAWQVTKLPTGIQLSPERLMPAKFISIPRLAKKAAVYPSPLVYHVNRGPESRQEG